jgi:hypothetical protein
MTPTLRTTRIRIVIVLLAGFSGRSMAQSADSLAVDDTLSVNKTAIGSLSALRAITIRLGNTEKILPSGLASLFQHFEVIDERPDTARIGIHTDRSKVDGSYNKQLIFPRPLPQEIGSYLDARFSRPGAPYTALIVIRTLWLSDANNILEDMVKDPDKHTEKTKIRLKAEIYAQKDGLYIPVFRFDSLQVSSKGSKYKRFSDNLTGMLEEMADSAAQVLAEKAPESAKITLPAILEFNRSRFDTNISKDDSLRKGIYMNFEEFKNNSPSMLNYEIKKEKDNLFLYVKEKGGNTYYSHSAWGLCDGKTVYIMKDGTLVPAWKEGRAWYLFSRAALEDPSRQDKPSFGMILPSQTITSAASAVVMMGGMDAVGDTPKNIKKSMSQKHIFTVDMDTGKLY